MFIRQDFLRAASAIVRSPYRASVSMAIVQHNFQVRRYGEEDYLIIQRELKERRLALQEELNRLDKVERDVRFAWQVQKKSRGKEHAKR